MAFSFISTPIFQDFCHFREARLVWNAGEKQEGVRAFI